MCTWNHLCTTVPIGADPWNYQELSADLCAWPQKGPHGYDNGDWQRLHWHRWTPSEIRIDNIWGLWYKGIGYANVLLSDIEKIDFQSLRVPIERKQMRAELKIYRAYCYWQLMDLFGDIPISETVGEISPSTRPRKDVYQWIEKEIRENIPDLSEDVISSYGRVSKWGAYALLCKIYLNAEVYSGEAKYEKAKDICDTIIASSKFQLDPAWNTPFLRNNDKLSSENIWVVAFDEINAKGFCWFTCWFHYSMHNGWGLRRGQTWNGIVCTPTFYDSFANNDKRKTEGHLIGMQFEQKDYNGNGIIDTLRGTVEYRDKYLILVNEIKSMTLGEENSGARSIKYECYERATGDMDNDWVIFRYADILLTKAECIMRLNNRKATQEAVNLLNDVRQRAFSQEDFASMCYTVENLTMDELLRERGRELCYEGHRRTDLIRFDAFVHTTWWDHTPTQNEADNLFPIPKNRLNNNSNLKGNAANHK